LIAEELGHDVPPAAENVALRAAIPEFDLHLRMRHGEAVQLVGDLAPVRNTRGGDEEPVNGERDLRTTFDELGDRGGEVGGGEGDVPLALDRFAGAVRCLSRKVDAVLALPWGPVEPNPAKAALLLGDPAQEQLVSLPRQLVQRQVLEPRRNDQRAAAVHVPPFRILPARHSSTVEPVSPARACGLSLSRR